MNIFRTRALPHDLKSFTSMAQNEDRNEALRTILAAILVAAVLLVVMFAGVTPDPVANPVGREELRR